MSKETNEAEEVARRYERRNTGAGDDRYSMLRPEVLLSFQERQRRLVEFFSAKLRIRLGDIRVLEIGCGTGGNLVELIGMGFNPANLVGNELLPERIAAARQKLPPDVRLIEGDATKLDFPDQEFDVVYQSTVFTSLLDSQFQQRLAALMWRWTAAGGGVLWYDFTFDNPGNPDVRGVSVRRIHELFPESSVHVKRVTLAPPISRRVSQVHPVLYHVFNSVPLLRTHVLCWIGKNGKSK